MRVLISACLLGVQCRYDGTGNLQEAWLEQLKAHTLIPVCPEQLGGLPTPRPPAEILSENPLRVMDCNGCDVTEAFIKGAEETLKLARLLGAACAVLKERSPSCGVNMIYDGTFNKIRLPGAGLTARLLKAEGIPVFSEEELERFTRFCLEGRQCNQNVFV